MFTLTKEEVELLMKSSDPAVVAATKKLIEAEEKGEFIPKSRLQKELDANKAIATKLAEYESAQKLAEEEKAKKNGELDKILKLREDELSASKLALEAEKKEADQFRAFRKTAIEAVKKQMGEKWLPEYENFSIESLSKIAGQTVPIIGTINAGGKPPETTSLEQKLAAAQKTGKLVEVVALRNQLAAQNT